MPVAAIDPTNTERWYVIYTVNTDQHALMVRTDDGALPANVSSAIGGIFSRLAGSLNTLTPLRLERALRGSNVRNPFAWTGAATYGAGNDNASDGRVRTVSFTGRSSGGHKVKFFVFGWKQEGQGDYRLTAGENVPVADTLAYLNTASGFLLAIDGVQPVWNQYANVGYNDHWIKTSRR